MQKTFLPLISDTVFTLVAAFTAAFCLMRFYRVQLSLALILSAILGGAFACTVFFYGLNKRKKQGLISLGEEEQGRLLLHLALLPPIKQRELFSGLVGENDALLFRVEPISADEIARVVGEYGADITVYCKKLSENAKRLANELGVKVVEANGVYELLKSNSRLPEKYLCQTRKKQGVITRVQAGFSKRNALSFFRNGLLLLFLSLFSLFPVYYLVVGCALTLTALFLRLFAKG